MLKPTDFDTADWAIMPVEPDEMRDMWRQAHHAAQAMVEIGKSWGEPRDDDAHSAMAWDEELEEFRTVGTGERGVVAGRMDVGAGVLFVDLEEAEGAWMALDGRTAGEAAAWVRAAAERLTGSGPKQPGAPAPDLPEHPVGAGRAFEMGPDAVEAGEALDAMYLTAGDVLTQLRAVLGDAHGAADDDATPRIWPHHFDAASLFVVERDAAGDMTKTIGVGVTPPDSIDESGYWYVSGWAKGGASGEPDALPAGRWRARDAGPPMAILPIDDFRDVEDLHVRAERLAAFVAAAFNANLEMLQG